MTRVTPSVVVAFIDRMFPRIAEWTVAQSQGANLGSSFAVGLGALIELVEQVPSELMPADAERYAELISSVAAIRTQIGTWQSRGQVGDLGYRTELGDLHPVSLIHRALAGVPDDLPSAETATISFIDDPVLKAALRLDISWASSALRNREWKAATVLAGSVIEALLLWELQRPHHEPIPKIRNGSLDDWYLSDYIKAAKKLRCVKNETITDVEKAQNYRNLIHPGASVRRGQACDLGTAHFAIGALDHVIRDLEKPECPRHANR